MCNTVPRKGTATRLRCCAAQRKECTSGRVFQSKCPLLQTLRCQILFISAERLVASLNRPFVRITNSCLRNMFNLLYKLPSHLPGIRINVSHMQFGIIHFIFSSYLIFIEEIKSKIKSLFNPLIDSIHNRLYVTLKHKLEKIEMIITRQIIKILCTLLFDLLSRQVIMSLFIDAKQARSFIIELVQLRYPNVTIRIDIFICKHADITGLYIESRVPWRFVKLYDET